MEGDRFQEILEIAYVERLIELGGKKRDMNEKSKKKINEEKQHNKAGMKDGEKRRRNKGKNSAKDKVEKKKRNRRSRVEE